MPRIEKVYRSSDGQIYEKEMDAEKRQIEIDIIGWLEGYRAAYLRKNLNDESIEIVAKAIADDRSKVLNILSYED